MKNLNRTNEQPMLGGLKIFLVFILSVTLFASCTERKTDDEQGGLNDSIPDSVYAQKGNRIVALSFDTLRNSLLHAIGSSSMEEAISFCNERAYPITATYADSVVIRRTSLLVRNPNNKPDSLEFITLGKMMEQMKFVKIPDAKVIRHANTGEIHFFKPIMLQSMCLNCHGTPGKQIQNATLARIQQIYPDDKAVNFKEGDLRGVWHIIFNAQKTNSAVH